MAHAMSLLTIVCLCGAFMAAVPASAEVAVYLLAYSAVLTYFHVLAFWRQYFPSKPAA